MENLQPKDVKVIRAASEVGPKMKLRVAAYCRVSSDSDDQENSFLEQVKYYNDFIRRSDDMEFVDIYADEGISGTSISKREDFQRMMRDSGQGKIDRIYVKSITRFARNALECMETLRILKTNGTSVYFENDGLNTESMNSEMILYIKSAFAQSEALAGSKRVSTACRMRMESGTFVTTSAPFGYRLEERRLVAVPRQAEIVRRIYDMYLSGLGVNKIVIKLNETEKEYAPWRRGRVESILRNEKYIGDSLWQKRYTPAILPLKPVRNHGEVDQYYVENTHEAIVDKAAFEKVQSLYEKRIKPMAERPMPQKRRYTGILWCGDCGNAYKSKRPQEATRWVCCQNGIAGCRCNTTSVTESEVERTFVNFYNKLKQNESIIIQRAYTQIAAAKRLVTAGSESIGEIDREIASLAGENSMYLLYYQRGVVDDVTFREQTGVVSKRINELKARRQKLLHEDKEEICIELLKQTKEQLARMPDAIIWFAPDIFSALIKKVYVISKETLLFELSCGLKFREKIAWD